MLSLEALPLKEKFWLYLWWYPRFYFIEKKISIFLGRNLDDYLGPFCVCGHRFSNHDNCVCVRCDCYDFMTKKRKRDGLE
tara:strand:- start:234 stop:473 length:240 start_codon:yes stop_codon:yes gene_type:complete